MTTKSNFDHYVPDHIRKNRPEVYVRFADLFERPNEIGVRKLVPRAGAVAFLVDAAHRYRITVLSPTYGKPCSPVLLWDELRHALTDHFDGDALRARTVLVEFDFRKNPRETSPAFASPDEDGEWQVYAPE